MSVRLQQIRISEHVIYFSLVHVESLRLLKYTSESTSSRLIHAFG